MHRIVLASLALGGAVPASGSVRAAPAEAPDVVQAEHTQIGVVDGTPRGMNHTQHPGAQWYPEAGFGLFIHWGLASVRGLNLSWPMITGRVLATRRIADPEERARIVRDADYNLDGKPDSLTPNEYWSMAKDFHPESYDPDRWIRAAKAAGFQYAVLTAKHHEGFALWPSAYGDFNTKNYLGGRDLLKPYIEACRKYGLKVGLYYSPPDWHFDRDYMNFLARGAAAKLNPELPALGPDLKPRLTEPSAEAIARHRAAFSAYLRGQIEELLTRYGKIDLIWFDGNPGYPKGNEAISLDRIRALQPQIVINPRLNGRGDFTTYERKLPPARPNVGWAELCNTWTAGWPYMVDPATQDELPYRANAFVLGQLAQCRAWGINYLLDLGPKSNGELSERAYANLAEIAGWMKGNAAAVIGAAPLPPGETASVPATARGNRRYLFAIPRFRTGGKTAGRVAEIAAAAQIPPSLAGEYPDQQLPPTDDTFRLTGAGRPKAVTWLESGKTLVWAYAGSTVSVVVPASSRTKLVDVVSIEL